MLNYPPTHGEAPNYRGLRMAQGHPLYRGNAREFSRSHLAGPNELMTGPPRKSPLLEGFPGYIFSRLLSFGFQL